MARPRMKGANPVIIQVVNFNLKGPSDADYRRW